MKNKALIFKVLAAIIAVGGAFASVSANSTFAATTVYVRYSTADTTNTYCATVGTCERTGTQPCKVQVTINSVPSTIDAKRKPTSACSSVTLTTNTNSNVIASRILPNDAKLK